MVEAIRADVVATQSLTRRSSLDWRVSRAVGRVPRHEFVPAELRDRAYQNRPLAIGHGQTISQPYIVALMTDLNEPRETHVVLEVGTGSGYQAAVLAEIVRHVYTIEIVEPLASTAKKRLAKLRYDNVTVRHGDGYDGWPEHAPYDGIIVTAAGKQIPPPLIAQLKPGGRLVMPVGDAIGSDVLVLVCKDAAGNVTTRNVLPVSFVPLTRSR